MLLLSASPSASPLLEMTIQVKHSRLWLPDGNIVLAGKPSPNFDNSNDEYPAGTLVQVLFCVHKSTLARQSQVFKDMLDITSEGANAGDLYDGLPLVALEDSASDLNGILQVLYDPWYVISTHFMWLYAFHLIIQL